MTALRPGAPPKPTPAPRERKPLKATVHRIPDSVREATYARDGWLCQWCLGAGGRLDLHHKLRRSQGGKDEAANLVSVHRVCHGQIHANPEIARHRGFLVGNGSNDE
jgi:5-methylcytosine-specific restriction endonuclease McrA